MTLTIAELAQALNGRLWGEGRLVVTGAAEAGQAGEGQIALATSPAYTTRLAPGGMALLAEGADPEALGLTARAGLRAECLKDPRAVWDAALAYCLVVLVGKVVLGETVSRRRWLGTLVITAGVMLVAVAGTQA